MNKKNPKIKYSKTYQFPEDTHNFIESLMMGRTLHCCCGNSLLGDTRIDIEKQPDQDSKPGFIQGDIFEILKRPFHLDGEWAYEKFDTVICDPLWHMPYQKRPGLAFMLRDHVKKGGRLILNALWIPKIKTMSDPVIYVGKNTMAWRNVSLILVYEKLEDGNSTSLGYPFEKEIPPCTPLQKN